MQQTPNWIQLIFMVPQQQWAIALAFWPEATGWHPVSAGAHRRDLTPGSGDGWVVLEAARATEFEVHLELVSTDGESALSHALQQGASPPDETSPMRSPGGMAFRYADATSQRRFNRAGLEHVLDQVCLDIPAPLWAAEVAFWEAMIGRESQTRGRPEFARLIDPDPQGSPRILLQRLDTRRGSVRGHCDFAVADRQFETARHLALGAQRVNVMPRWTVMRAPDSTIYCLTDRDPTTGLAG